tara:strand:- start:1798 stop:2016 length:219 start_codon:yes stop_codon:yes gene_type:complete
MKKEDLAVIAYISLIIIVWGSIGSLVDYPLLQAKIYKAGSIGQFLTFTLTGFIFTLAGIKLYPITINKLFNK